MPSPRRPIVWLLVKEWRELMASRAFWVMLALVGPLVGLSFIDAVGAFSEVSAGAGVGCGAVCDPLVGVWGPTFGAYEIAAVFLLPFVAIRLVSNDQQNGALKLELQRPLSPVVRIAAKAAVVLAGWCLAGLAALAAIVLWKTYGGTINVPELAVVALGHLLNAGLTVALAVAVASMTDHPSTAAIVTLAITIGTWVVDFAAAVHGGLWERLAAYTPASMVSLFQHGLLQVSVVLIVCALTGTGLAAAAVWLRAGVPLRRRFRESVAVAAGATAVIAACTLVRGSWDASESRQNSFPEAEAEALERLPGPLAIGIHLSPQDPRRLLFERGPLAKLRRTVPHLTVSYISRTQSGLYEQADAGYGEITYEVAGKRGASRVITDEGVAETVLGLVGLEPNESGESVYRGHPLQSRASGAPAVFYGVWPAAVIGISLIVMRRRT